MALEKLSEEEMSHIKGGDEHWEIINDQCKDCLLFPVCSGGCGWYKYKNTFESGNFRVCSQFKDKHNLEKSLIYTLEKNSSSLKMLQV